MLKSSWAAPVGLSTQDRSSTGAAGGREAPRTVQLAMPMAMKPAAMPRALGELEGLRPDGADAATGLVEGGGLAHQVGELVGRPARSIATPPGCAVVRSSVPLGRSRYHSRVLRPPRSTRWRCQTPTAAAVQRGVASAGGVAGGSLRLSCGTAGGGAQDRLVAGSPVQANERRCPRCDAAAGACPGGQRCLRPRRTRARGGRAP